MSTVANTPAGRAIIDAADQETEAAAGVADDLRVQCAVVGQDGVAHLAPEAPGEPLGQHLALEATDIGPVERLRGISERGQDPLDTPSRRLWHGRPPRWVTSFAGGCLTRAVAVIS